MKILADMLKESKDYYLDVESRVKERLRHIPRGSIQKKRFSNCKGNYYYLAYRQGNRVVNKYLGKEIPAKLQKDVEERKNLLKRLKSVQENISILRRLRWEPHARRHRLLAA